MLCWFRPNVEIFFLPFKAKDHGSNAKLNLGLSLVEKGGEKDFGALHLQFKYFLFATNILVLCTIASF
jgi:hypothetical protein